MLPASIIPHSGWYSASLFDAAALSAALILADFYDAGRVIGSLCKDSNREDTEPPQPGERHRVFFGGTNDLCGSPDNKSNLFRGRQNLPQKGHRELCGPYGE